MHRQTQIRLGPPLVVLCLVLSACQIAVTTPTSGGVTSTSGDVDCVAGETCEVDVADTNFDEEFVGQPVEGFVFDHWKEGQGNLCGGLTNSCPFSTEGLPDSEALQAILNDPNAAVALEPVFAVDRTTDSIALVTEGTNTVIGGDWELDFYRNTEYDCGVSGNYTFMVIEPRDNPGASAPLWVAIHGGGAGYYDDQGIYRGISGQNANTWNHEETFDDLREINPYYPLLDNNGLPIDNTLVRRLLEGYRLLVPSMCDHDLYSGLGTAYPNNPNGGEVNGLQATMAAVDYTVANYPTTHVFAHGTSAGAAGAYSLAAGFAFEGIGLTGVVMDSGLITPRFQALDPLVGTPQFPFNSEYNFAELFAKIGFMINPDLPNDSESMVLNDFRASPLLLIGGDADEFCGGFNAPIAEAAAAGLNNCDWLYDGFRQAVANQPNSPHQVTIIDGEGHVPTHDPNSTGSDIVDVYIDDLLAANPPYPFAE